MLSRDEQAASVAKPDALAHIPLWRPGAKSTPVYTDPEYWASASKWITGTLPALVAGAEWFHRVPQVEVSC